MANKNESRCLCCGAIFTADVRNRGRQKYCRKVECQRAAKAARQDQWLRTRKGKDYFRGPVHVQRVRDWRAIHPRYWRADRRGGQRIALQDGLITQALEQAGKSEGSGALALQDALQPPLGACYNNSSQTSSQPVPPMAIKRVLRPERLRRTPEQFSWIDQRLARDRYIERCDTQALALYLLLVTVSDTQGLSYYGDTTICRLLSMEPGRLEEARRDLIDVGLIAYEQPLYQVLALDPSPPPRRAGMQSVQVAMQRLPALAGRRTDEDAHPSARERKKDSSS
jgi:hypothetical protein